MKYYKVIYNDGNRNLISEVYWGLNSNKNVELKSKYKYSTDGSGREGTWLVTQGSSNTPSVDYANKSANGTNCWERFESFDALYASVAIIENGTVGSAVFNGNYMFSQQGITSEGVYSDSYEKFNSIEPYNEKNEFRPNICIDFKKGDMVQHTAFGRGMVLSVMKMGGDALLEIAFDQIGTKKLMAKTASAHMKKL